MSQAFVFVDFVFVDFVFSVSSLFTRHRSLARRTL